MSFVSSACKVLYIEIGRASYKSWTSKAYCCSEFMHPRRDLQANENIFHFNYPLYGNPEVKVEIISKCRHENKYYFWTQWPNVALTSVNI